MQNSKHKPKSLLNITRVAFVTALSALSISAQAGLFSDTKKVTILHTNDHHGHFWQNKHGEQGMAARATLIKQIKAEVEADGSSVLLLSGGDINTGTPESDMQNAEPDFIGMNMLGYDAMAVGNHEFDNPLDVLMWQKELANFPFLAANIYKNGKRLFKPYTVFERSGLKIAVIGLTTEDTANIGNPEFIKGIEFRDPKKEVQIAINELKASIKPDITIAVTHMGHYQNGAYGSNAPGDVTLARSLKAGSLDMIVGGHSQKPVCMTAENVLDQDYKPSTECKPDQQNGIYIMQAHEWGKYVGRADFEVSDGELELINYTLIPVNLKQKATLLGKTKRIYIQDEIKQDPSVLAALEPFQKKGQAALDVVIANTNGDLIGERKIVRSQQTNLGRLIAAAHMDRVNADFSVMNSGGVRASIEKGPITYRDVLTVQPFANTVGVVEMTGAEVLEYLSVVANIKAGSGGYAQFANVSMTVTNGTVKNVRIGGKPLNKKKIYRFTVPSYNAAGGNSYPDITGHKSYFDSGYVDADALKHYLSKLKNIDVSKFNPKGEIKTQ